MDALDRVAFRPFGPKQKAEFKKMKVEEELSSTLGDRNKVKTLASKFEETIRKQRAEEALSALLQRSKLSSCGLETKQKK